MRAIALKAMSVEDVMGVLLYHGDISDGINCMQKSQRLFPLTAIDVVVHIRTSIRWASIPGELCVYS